MLGAGRGLTASELAVVDARVRAQLAYLSRFADEVALRRLDEVPLAPLSEEAVGARLSLYGGEARASFYAARERDAAGGYVVDYVAADDGGTCSPCLRAMINSPYLPDDVDTPYPGRVCRGRGRCRCRRELRYAPDEHRALAARAA